LAPGFLFRKRDLSETAKAKRDELPREQLPRQRFRSISSGLHFLDLFYLRLAQPADEIRQRDETDWLEIIRGVTPGFRDAPEQEGA
jgi:hypothetical protein